MKILIAILFTFNTYASDKGTEIASKVYNRDNGRTQISFIEMTLQDKSGSKQVRELYNYTLEGKKGEAKTLIRFTNPADISNTGLLTHNYRNKENDQWIFLPALKRSRRISSSRKGGSFVGSDYYYEDLEDRPVEKDKHVHKGQKKWKGNTYELIVSVPVDKDNSVYTKRVSYVDMEKLIYSRIAFYQKKKKPVKLLEVLETKKIDGIWTPTKVVMKDLQSGHITQLHLQKVKYNSKLPETLFSKRALEDPTMELRYRKAL